MKLVIVGGGIMGVATAFYSRKLHDSKVEPEEDLEIVIIDSLGIARGASGKAGGFLAKDWATGYLKKIAEKAFEVFPDLAEEFGHETLQYRRISSYNGCVVRDNKSKVQQPAKSRNNRKRDVFNNVFDKAKLTPGEMIGTKETTAQVTPWFLSQELFKASKANFVKGELVGIRYDRHDKERIAAVIVKHEEDDKVWTEEIFGDEFCFCLGLWTQTLRNMNLVVPRSMGRKVHAVIVKPKESILEKLKYLETAIFTDFNNTEFIVRPNGVVYVNGSEKGYSPVDLKPNEIEANEKACKKIFGFWEYMTTKPNEGKNKKKYKLVELARNEHLEKNEEGEEGTKLIKNVGCYLPIVEHHYKGEQLPVMSPISRTSNGYICAGHTCWGILMGPLCGQIMSKMILEKDPNAIIDTKPFLYTPKIKKKRSRKHRNSRRVAEIHS